MAKCAGDVASVARAAATMVPGKSLGHRVGLDQTLSREDRLRAASADGRVEDAGAAVSGGPA